MAERYGAGGAVYNPPVVKTEKQTLTEVPPKTPARKKKTITNTPELQEHQTVLQELIDENSEILND